MTDKKRRQRGSRTHGGGTHKNRRGAGHRGGRGAAGRKKHEQRKHGPLGKHGFTRPLQVRDDVREVDLQTLDENADRYVEAGLAESTDGAVRIDVRDIVEGGHEADAVKVLGSGQVRGTLEVVADDFSDRAVEKLEAGGGAAELTERAESDKDEADTDSEEE